MHRRVIGFLLALPLLAGIAVWQADIKTDISAFFMAGDSPEVALIAGNMQTGELSRRYLLSISDTQSQEKPAEIVESFRAALESIDGISRVWGEGLSEEEVGALVDFYLPYRYRLFSLLPETDVPSLFSADALAARAEAIREGLLSPQGQQVKQILADDPMLLISSWLQRFSAGEPEPGRYASLVVETGAAGLDTARQLPIRNKIEQVFNRLNGESGDRYRLEMTGVPVFAMAVQQQVAADVKLVSTISMVAMLLLFLMLFRSLKALLSVSLILVASATVATILTSLVFGQIHALTLALGTTLIGICVDYPIHTMVHIAGGDGTADESSRRIWPSLLMGAVTTVVGYSALSFTGYPGMQQIALYAGAGILTALLLARFILPFAIAGRAQATKPSVSFSGWLGFAGKSRLRIPVLAVAALLLLSGISTMNWQDDLSRLSPSLESLKKKDHEIRSRMQSIEPGRFILVHANTMEQALQANESALRALEKLQGSGQLQASYSLFPWLASAALQQQNLQAFSEHLNRDSIEAWFAAVEAAGLRRSALKEPALHDVQPLTIDDLVLSPAHRYIAGQYLDDGRQVILTIWLGRHDADAVRAALAGIDHVRYISQKEMINGMNDAYRSKAIEALGYGALVILLLLTLRYRNIVTALRTLFPAMVSVAVVLGCWGLSCQPLGMLHMVGMLLAVAICVDYGIFFIENRARDTELTYQAIVVSALTTIVAFSSLGLAENPALQILAWTIAPGVFLGFALCPLLIRPGDGRKPAEKAG